MISVIVPVFNAEGTIGNCLKALKEQDCPDKYEVIVVDDSSTDNTEKMVRKFKVKLIRQKHSGPAAARNLGAKHARGSIVVFTDSDCVPTKNWLKEIVRPFSKNNIVGVQGAYRTKQKELVARFVQLEIEDRYDRMLKAKNIDFIGSYSAAYRRDIFMKFGGFDESFPAASGEDPELSFKLAEKGYKMEFNPNAIVYHIHPDTVRKYLKQKLNRAYWRVFLYKKHSGKMLKDTYTPQTLKIQIALLYAAFISVVAMVFSYGFSYPAALFFMLLVASTIPFSVKCSHKDSAVAAAAPALLILRTIVFSIGLIVGRLRR